MNVIGIDPGITGAVALVTNTFQHVIDLPTEQNGAGTAKVKRKINASMLKLALMDLIIPSQDTVIVIESVSSRSGQGVAGMFSLGDTCGCIRGVCESLYPTYPIEYVGPKDWKSHFKLSRDKGESLHSYKERSLLLARELFPKMPLTRKKDNNRAEALLIAQYWREK